MSLADRDNEPVLTQWDAWGQRVDRIEVSPLWREAHVLAATHGMVWESRAYPSSLAVMFFGDRVPPGALSVVSAVRVDADPSLAARFKALADRSGVSLIV